MSGQNRSHLVHLVVGLLLVLSFFALLSAVIWTSSPQVRLTMLIAAGFTGISAMVVLAYSWKSRFEKLERTVALLQMSVEAHIQDCSAENDLAEAVQRFVAAHRKPIDR